MKIEIDQSIKIEDTARPTFVADSLGNGIWISSNDKKYLQMIFRKAGKKKMFVIQTFAAAVAFLIVQSDRKGVKWVIDQEYDGLDQVIKTYLLRYLKRLGSGMDADGISFSRIGKKS